MLRLVMLLCHGTRIADAAPNCMGSFTSTERRSASIFAARLVTQQALLARVMLCSSMNAAPDWVGGYRHCVAYFHSYVTSSGFYLVAVA